VPAKKGVIMRKSKVEEITRRAQYRYGTYNVKGTGPDANPQPSFSNKAGIMLDANHPIPAYTMTFVRTVKNQPSEKCGPRKKIYMLVVGKPKVESSERADNSTQASLREVT
jgi:hypothetical protein